jgi:acetyltransferase-like isoleucine patch superfamily enzyme
MPVDSASGDTVLNASALRRSLVEDTVKARNHLVRNTVAGSVFVPRALRWAIYRLSGLQIRTPNILENCVMNNSHVDIDADVFVNRNVYFEGSGSIRIVSGTQIGPEVVMLTSHHSRGEDGHVSRVPSARPILVEANVWIGARAILLPGAVIERDCVVAAGAVVSGRCERGGLYGGVPARLLRPSG